MKPDKPLILLVLLLFTACRSPVQELPDAQEADPHREQFIRVNRYLQQRQQDHISAFVERAGMDAFTTSSGLWVSVIEKGRGARIAPDERIRFIYESRLLSGELCYSATKAMPMEIVSGKGDVEAGVEEAFRHLSHGDSAILFIPSHLAHGNFGDRDRIPGNSILFYSLRILEAQ